MAALASMLQERGWQVSGSDAAAYPPMSDLLAARGIAVEPGYEAGRLDKSFALVVVGNVAARSNVEALRAQELGLCCRSLPETLWHEFLSSSEHRLVVAGTHGKTSTASILAWILEYAGLAPGFLIGGVPKNFGLSARLGSGPFFVVEADEYDTAFFDKRSKFVHYHPRTLVLNNLEYDHADIFPDLDAIKTQFHHLVRTVPGNGLIISNAGDENLHEVLQRGCWTPVEAVSTANNKAMWQARLLLEDGSRFEVLLEGKSAGTVSWNQLGDHNVHNAMAAIVAARHAGVPLQQAIAALSEFEGIKRRMEVRGQVAGVTVYDDFAHHPTAIATTLQGLRRRVGDARILLLLEPRSNTMRMGVHGDALAASWSDADRVWLHEPAGLEWSLKELAESAETPVVVSDSVDAIVEAVLQEAQAGDHVLVMSNGAFGGIHDKLIQRLESSS